MPEAMKKEYEIELEHNQLDVRNFVMQSVEQIQHGKTKDFNEVCERLEKKYTNA